MSSKTIFSDLNSTYIPISADDWNSTITNDPVYQYNLTMSQDGDNEYPLTLSITPLFGSYNYIMSVHSGLLSLTNTRVATGSNAIWKSTTPIDSRYYNPNVGIQLGYVNGAVFYGNTTITRPCDFNFFLDTNGYLYIAQAYNSGITSTNVWTQGVAVGYSYVPACSTTGNCNAGDAFATGNLLISDCSFVVSTLRATITNGSLAISV